MIILRSVKMRGNIHLCFPSSFFPEVRTKKTGAAALHFTPLSWVTRMLEQSWDHRSQASRRQRAGSSLRWQGDSNRAVLEAAAHPFFWLQHQRWAMSRFYRSPR